MNPHKQLAIRALENMRSDDLARARRAFSHYTPAQMNTLYGQSNRTRQIKSYPVSCFTTYLEASRDTYRHCARELASVNTFKFVVGDEVTTSSGERLIILSRHESLQDKKLLRSYVCDDYKGYQENELQYHSNHPRQTRSRPGGRKK